MGKVGRIGYNVTGFVTKLSIEKIESIKVDENSFISSSFLLAHIYKTIYFNKVLSGPVLSRKI